MQEEGRRWSIDALDADGGIAFASFRQSGEADIGDLEVEHAVVVAAPHFRPVPVSSRALSLGAISQGAQSGVYGDSGEVRFDSLDQLVEFVRKVYVGGGANGATPAPETVPTPPEGPDEGGDAGEGYPWRLRNASHAILQWLTVADSEGLTGGPPPPFFSDDDTHYGSGQVIARTAASIGASLIQRMPYPDDAIEDQSRWVTTMHHFQQLLQCIDMSEFLMDPPMEELLTSIGVRLLKDPKRLARLSEQDIELYEGTDELAWAIHHLAVNGTVDHPLYELGIDDLYRHYRYDRYGAYHDVFRTLDELPIPGDIPRPYDLGDGASIADFLAYCCATSTIPVSSIPAIGAVVFAAFCLVASPRTSGFEVTGKFSSAPFQVAYRDAMQWLSQQFRGLLPEELRQMVIGIRNVSQLNKEESWTTNLSGGNVAT